MASRYLLGENCQWSIGETQVAPKPSGASVCPNVDSHKRGGAENARAWPRLENVTPPSQFSTHWMGQAASPRWMAHSGIVQAAQEGLATGEHLRDELEKASNPLHVKEVG